MTTEVPYRNEVTATPSSRWASRAFSGALDGRTLNQVWRPVLACLALAFFGLLGDHEARLLEDAKTKGLLLSVFGRITAWLETRR